MVNLIKQIIETTVGRVLFNEFVPKEVGYINEILTKKSLRDIIGSVLKIAGTASTANFLDDIKNLGFQYGISEVDCHLTLTMLLFLKKKTNLLMKDMSRLMKC